MPQAAKDRTRNEFREKDEFYSIRGHEPPMGLETNPETSARTLLSAPLSLAPPATIAVRGPVGPSEDGGHLHKPAGGGTNSGNERLTTIAVRRAHSHPRPPSTPSADESFLYVFTTSRRMYTCVG